MNSWVIFSFWCVIAILSPVSRADYEYNQVIRDGVLSFGDKLQKLLYPGGSTENNIVFSPLNLFSSLNMMYLASSSSTLKELASVMGYGEQTSHTHAVSTSKDLGTVFERLEKSTPETKEILGNAMFCDSGFPPNYEYQQTLNKHFPNLEVKQLEIASSPSAAAKEINNWVAKQTDNRILDISNVSLDSTTSAVIINTLHFSGNWINKFPKVQTKKEKFNTGVRQVDIEMMVKQDTVPYVKNLNLRFEAIRIPFQGDGYELVVILPNENTKLEDIVKNIQLKDISEVFNNEGNEGLINGVEMKIPKMKFSWNKSLKSDLEQLGLRTTFQVSNFPHLTDKSGFKVSDLHQAVEVEIYEDGAAVSQLAQPPITPITPFGTNVLSSTIKFNVNRPFWMMLYHRPTQTIQFSSLVHHPKP